MEDSCEAKETDLVGRNCFDNFKHFKGLVASALQKTKNKTTTQKRMEFIQIQ